MAVTAMISPAETLTYYKALLTYLAGKLEYEVRLIQRRTYREVNELFLKFEIPVTSTNPKSARTISSSQTCDR